MKARASEVATAVGGSVVGPDAGVDGVAIDSRLIAGGELFVPVVAARDGHLFVEDAMRAGAAAYLTSEGAQGGTAVEVKDTMVALADLARWWRSRLTSGRVAAVTGSVGKTSTKDLLRSVLCRRYVTTASPRSFNNELGVPLTILAADESSEAVVVEMGARAPGHLRALCDIARPSVGLVTSVTAAHTEFFGTIDDVARAKGELVEALPSAGTAVLNADDALVAAMRELTSANVVTFGLGAGDVRASDVVVDDDLRAVFRLESPWGATGIALRARGEHQVANALAAAAAALAMDATLDEVARGLADAELSPWRMELLRTSSGALVLNDAYNANPASTAAALRALARLDAARHVAVLGPMAELGALGADAHREIGALARELGIRVIAVGAPEYGGDNVAGLAEARRALGDVGEGDAVLVKGSRVAGLERLAAELVGGEPA